MSLETDLLLDRRRLKRRLFFWRSFAVLAVLAAVLVVLRGSGLALGRAHVARLPVSGIITEDRKLDEAVDKLADDDSVKALIVASTARAAAWQAARACMTPSPVSPRRSRSSR